MSMKRNKKERPGFFSRLLATIASVRKHPTRDVEEEPPQSEESENTPIGLPGSQWLFGCSAGSGGEIASGYDQEELPDVSGTEVSENCFLPVKNDIVRDKKTGIVG